MTNLNLSESFREGKTFTGEQTLLSVPPTYSTLQLSSCRLDYYLSQSNKLSFCAWNINGLSSKSLGNKLRDPDCLRMINNFDFIILSETWKSVSIDLEGCLLYTSDAADE